MTTTLILALALTSQAGGKAPKTFTSKEGGFSASMPGKPKVTTQSVESPAGELVMHLFVVEGTEAAYVVSYCDYPEELVAKADPRKMLEGAQKGSIESAKGEAVAEEEIELDGFPGKAFTYAMPNGPIPDGFGKARYYMVKRRMYQVLVMGTKAKVQSKATDRFLKSFKLISTKEAPK